jgi:hypothetical protein
MRGCFRARGPRRTLGIPPHVNGENVPACEGGGAPNGAATWSPASALPSPCGSGPGFRGARPRRRASRVAVRRSTWRLFCPRRRASVGRKPAGKARRSGAASAARRRPSVQPLKAAGHSAGGRTGRGLPILRLQAAAAGAAATPRPAVSCRTPLTRGGCR